MNENKKNLAYLISQYPAVSHTFILREIKGLREEGFTIKTISINSADIDFEKEEIDSTYYVKKAGIFNAIRCVSMTLLTHPYQFFRGLFYSISLGKSSLKNILWSIFYFIEATIVGQWMKSEGCSHLHVHFANAASTVALIAQEIFPITFSITVHGPDEFYEVTQFHLNEKIIQSKFIICISYYARSQLMRLSSPKYWDKLIVCYLGVNTTDYAPKKFNPNPNPFCLVCIGRLVPAKGQNLLLKMMRKLLDKGFAVSLHLVGDGSDRKNLEAESEHLSLTESVFFHGSLDQRNTYKVLQGADLFILPSFAEGLPIVLMEAMSMEIPVVATEITGIPELVDNEVDGLLVPASSEEGLIQSVIRLIEDPKLREKLSFAGRRKIINKFEIKENINKLSYIFKNKLNLKNNFN